MDTSDSFHYTLPETEHRQEALYLTTSDVYSEMKRILDTQQILV